MYWPRIYSTSTSLGPRRSVFQKMGHSTLTPSKFFPYLTAKLSSTSVKLHPFVPACTLWEVCTTCFSLRMVTGNFMSGPSPMNDLLKHPDYPKRSIRGAKMAILTPSSRWLGNGNSWGVTFTYSTTRIIRLPIRLVKIYLLTQTTLLWSMHYLGFQHVA